MDVFVRSLRVTQNSLLGAFIIVICGGGIPRLQYV